MNDHAKSYENWTRKEFEALPKLDISEFDYTAKIDAFVIIPTRKKHDSGFRIMNIAPIINRKPIGRFADMTDSIQLGNYHKDTNVLWAMDCLPASGLIRYWAKYQDCFVISPYSTFEIHSEKQKY